jgi:hypothetical protein
VALSLDLVARRAVMSAMLYYGLDHPVLSDEEYDRANQRVIAEWANLSPLLKWQLGSPTDLAATGFQIKVTMACAGGAASWSGVRCVPTEPWKFSKKHQVHWLNAGAFRVR